MDGRIYSSCCRKNRISAGRHYFASDLLLETVGHLLSKASLLNVGVQDSVQHSPPVLIVKLRVSLMLEMGWTKGRLLGALRYFLNVSNYCAWWRLAECSKRYHAAMLFNKIGDYFRLSLPGPTRGFCTTILRNRSRRQLKSVFTRGDRTANSAEVGHRHLKCEKVWSSPSFLSCICHHDTSVYPAIL